MTLYEVLEIIDLPTLLAAEDGGGTKKGSGGGMSMMLMMVAMVGIMYFVMIRPRQKQEKEVQRQRDSMRIGDGVVTIGGIHGIVTNKNDSKGTVTLRVAEGKLKFDRSAIAKVVPSDKGGDSEEDAEDGEDDENEDK